MSKVYTTSPDKPVWDADMDYWLSDTNPNIKGFISSGGLNRFSLSGELNIEYVSGIKCCYGHRSFKPF